VLPPNQRFDQPPTVDAWASYRSKLAESRRARMPADTVPYCCGAIGPAELEARLVFDLQCGRLTARSREGRIGRRERESCDWFRTERPALVRSSNTTLGSQTE
jgi:hypothetical protein